MCMHVGRLLLTFDARGLSNTIWAHAHLKSADSAVLPRLLDGYAVRTPALQAALRRGCHDREPVSVSQPLLFKKDAQGPSPGEGQADCLAEDTAIFRHSLQPRHCSAAFRPVEHEHACITVRPAAERSGHAGQAVVCMSLSARAVGCLSNHASAGSLTSVLLKRLVYRVPGHFFDGSEVQGCPRGLLFRGIPFSQSGSSR